MAVIVRCILRSSRLTGKTLPKPIIVSRLRGNWNRNFIRGVTLEPGDMVVREVYLYQNDLNDPIGKAKIAQGVEEYDEYTVTFPSFAYDRSSARLQTCALSSRFLLLS